MTDTDTLARATAHIRASGHKQRLTALAGELATAYGLSRQEATRLIIETLMADMTR